MVCTCKKLNHAKIAQFIKITKKMDGKLNQQRVQTKVFFDSIKKFFKKAHKNVGRKIYAIIIFIITHTRKFNHLFSQIACNCNQKNIVMRKM